MRVKRGIGVSFDEQTLRTIDRALSRCQNQCAADENDSVMICTLDGSVCDYEHCQRLEKKAGVFYGQFESRSKFVEYCILLVISIAESDRKSLQFVRDFIEALSDRPELGPKIAFFLKELK